MSLDRKTGNILIPLRGGKGGVGRSILSIGLDNAIERSGKNIILEDLGLGTANLHTSLGVLGRTQTTADFILSKAPSLENLPSRPR